MPFVVSIQEEQDKAAYLKNLFEQVYFRDILERYDIRRKDILDSLVSVLASSVGSLTNPQKYISIPQKYYFTDLGLRNARLNFRQQEETHLMEMHCIMNCYKTLPGISKTDERGHYKNRISF